MLLGWIGCQPVAFLFFSFLYDLFNCKLGIWALIFIFLLIVSNTRFSFIWFSSPFLFRPEECPGPIPSRFHSFICNLGSCHFDLLIFPSPSSFFLSFSFLIPFDHSLLKSHRFDTVASDPFFHWLSERYEIWWIFRSKVLMLCEILGFLLFLYPYPAGTVFESLENLFFPYESILLHSNSFPPIPIPNWILNCRVSVSLSMRLCTLRIEESIWWKILAFVLWWVSEILSMTYVLLKGYLSDWLRKAWGSKGTGSSIQKRQFFSLLY